MYCLFNPYIQLCEYHTTVCCLCTLEGKQIGTTPKMLTYSFNSMHHLCLNSARRRSVEFASCLPHILWRNFKWSEIWEETGRLFLAVAPDCGLISHLLISPTQRIVRHWADMALLPGTDPTHLRLQDIIYHHRLCEWACQHTLRCNLQRLCLSSLTNPRLIAPWGLKNLLSVTCRALLDQHIWVYSCLGVHEARQSSLKP